MNPDAYPSLISFHPKRSREPGSLSVAEPPSLPFQPRRIFWTYDVPEGAERGGHAHRTLWQVLLCMSGSLTVHLDDGMGWKKDIILADPSEGLLLPPPFWHTMTFGRPGSVLLSIASDTYTESDYIRDYDEFLRTREPGNAGALQ